MVSVEIKKGEAVLNIHIDGKSAAFTSAQFSTENRPEVAIGGEFSTNTDTAVIAAHLYDKNGRYVRSENYDLANSGTLNSETGWYKADGCYVETYGFRFLALELVSITGGSIDLWA